MKTIFRILLVCLISVQAFGQRSYYVSNSTGDDANNGTVESPWKSLEKISSTSLIPGDTVLFMCNDTLRGQFVVNGSGSEVQPILITAYGDGVKPVISGQVGAEGGGDYREAIFVHNHDNLIFDSLDVQNDRMESRAGINDTDAHGIYIRNSGTEVMKNFTFRNMDFKNVFAAQPMLDPEDFDKIQVAALRILSTKNTVAGKEKNIQNILVEKCLFANNQRFGIQFKHGGGSEGIGNDSINRNMNILIKNNEFSYNGGTGVLPNATYNCLIEHNLFDHPGADTDPRMPARGSSIWNFNAHNTIMQYNTCLSTRGYLDSYGIHIDKHNVNTFVQYNYMDDCVGGFVEILANNKNAVYRFNVSLNSGFRYTEGISDWKAGSSTIYIYSDRWAKDENGETTLLKLSDRVFINNNTVVIDKPFTTTFNIDAKNMFIYNNIFSSTNGATMGHLQYAVRNNDTPFTMRNNLYKGNVVSEWIQDDSQPVSGNPRFTGTGEEEKAFLLHSGSPAINAGVAITGPVVKNAGYGVFENVSAYPTVDLYGNPIDLSSGTPNIGACNDKQGEPGWSSQSSIEMPQNNWLAYPQLEQSKIKIISHSDINDSVTITLTNVKGQVVQTMHKEALGENEFDFYLDTVPANGIYVLNISNDKQSHSRKMLLFQ